MKNLGQLMKQAQGMQQQLAVRQLGRVRPDGTETFVQNGWLRADERALATTADNLLHQPSTLLEPVLSLRAADVSPMPSDQFVKVVIPLYFEGHVYRAGSRVRLTIAAPNGTQPVWSFSDTEPTSGTATESIEYSPSTPSSLILPVVANVSAPTGLPPCPSLRNEPCRPYVPLVNTSGSPLRDPATDAPSTQHQSDAQH